MPGGTVEPGTPTDRKLTARGDCLVGDIPVPSPPAAAEVDLVGEEAAAAAPVGLDGDVGAASGSGSSVASCHQSCSHLEEVLQVSQSSSHVVGLPVYPRRAAIAPPQTQSNPRLPSQGKYSSVHQHLA